MLRQGRDHLVGAFRSNTAVATLWPSSGDGAWPGHFRRWFYCLFGGFAVVLPFEYEGDFWIPSRTNRYERDLQGRYRSSCSGDRRLLWGDPMSRWTVDLPMATWTELEEQFVRRTSFSMLLNMTRTRAKITLRRSPSNTSQATGPSSIPRSRSIRSEVVVFGLIDVLSTPFLGRRVPFGLAFGFQRH